ncbi:hypothetical protein EDD54_0012 [Oharaeibacter diazotrophicus]|uniref:Uncharacterized protein n=1 Tax=Oharaeibacter diazotrophicus TaxID=1920512 RepID=A0A4R6RRZ9_9HYPH|nr:hypothetical protein EDD54_0012 [Oharaeibacter diazotrophicus]
MNAQARGIKRGVPPFYSFQIMAYPLYPLGNRSAKNSKSQSYIDW